jgi:hypothetical protein
MTKETKALYIYEEKLYSYYANYIKILADFGNQN